jgi:hypothetical protein
MSRQFSILTANSTFAQVNKPFTAGDYVVNKKIKHTFCPPILCDSKKTVNTYEKYYFLHKVNNPNLYFNRAQLYSNLYTKLDLTPLMNTNTPIIYDMSNNTFPSIINPDNIIPYVTYNIDPSGNLFGNTVCGLNNYLDYVVYDASVNEIN